MNSALLNILLVMMAFVLMEGVAWLTHKYVMHGILWTLHRDHHQPRGNSFWERNDFFFLIFAIPGIVCLYLGLDAGFNYLFWIGLGITLYGFAYFFVHDVFIHQRIRFLRNTDSRYFRAIRKAHKVHHKHMGKEHGESFGMLFVPARYMREAKKGKL